MQKIMRHRTEEPIAIEKLNPGVPIAFADVVRRMMAKQPDDRHVSAQAVREELLLWAERRLAQNAECSVPSPEEMIQEVEAAYADASFDLDSNFQDLGGTLWTTYGVPLLIGGVAGLGLVLLFFLLSR
jgi:hypothetical protein